MTSKWLSPTGQLCLEDGRQEAERTAAHSGESPGRAGLTPTPQWKAAQLPLLLFVFPYKVEYCSFKLCKHCIGILMKTTLISPLKRQGRLGDVGSDRLTGSEKDRSVVQAEKQESWFLLLLEDL